MPRRGGKRIKRRTHNPADDEVDSSVPRSFVFRRNKTDVTITGLVTDLRKMMMPNTADKLVERKTNRMRDFVDVAGPLGVTHFMMLSQTSAAANVNMRLARVPHGPTLYFKVKKYTLSKDVQHLQKRPMDLAPLFHSAPLIVLNNFVDCDKHLKLVSVTFQNMFPPINVERIRLSECRRVVLVHLDKESGNVELRHFAIRAAPLGISKPVKKITKTRIPDLGQLEDISELFGVSAGGFASDSEVDDEDAHVTLPQNYAGRGNTRANQSAIRLSEIGPRITMELTKVVKGLCNGEVLFNAHVKKTPEEVATQRAALAEKERVKKERREEQQRNVERKKAEKAAKKAEKLARKRARLEAAAKDAEGEDGDSGDAGDAGSDSDSDADEAGASAGGAGAGNGAGHASSGSDDGSSGDSSDDGADGSGGGDDSDSDDSDSGSGSGSDGGSDSESDSGSDSDESDEADAKPSGRGGRGARGGAGGPKAGDKRRR